MDLKKFFDNNKKIAVAFSGGVDSSYLLAEAVRCGTDICAYYVKSAFQPEFERRDALRLAESLGVKLTELEADVLSDEAITTNPADRCYFCKQKIMAAVSEAAHKDGYDILCDGSNASDDASDRPGFKALSEFGVRSPLRECGITKEEIRQRAKEIGLDIWDKPAYACLATRIPAGERITEEKLRITEEAESILREMGFRDFRVRMRGWNALVQISEDQHAEALERVQEIKDSIGGFYETVSIDKEPRRV